MWFWVGGLAAGGRKKRRASEAGVSESHHHYRQPHPSSALCLPSGGPRCAASGDATSSAEDPVGCSFDSERLTSTLLWLLIPLIARTNSYSLKNKF